MTKLLFTGVLMLLLSALTIKAQNPVTLDVLNIEDGLSDRVVRLLFHDRQGYLWVGTRNGLNRFEGSHFLVFDSRRPAPQTLSADDVTLLAQLRSGLLVIGYNNKSDGFDLLNPASGEVSPIKMPSSIQLARLLPNKKGDLFFIGLQDNIYTLWYFDDYHKKAILLSRLPGYSSASQAIAASTEKVWYTTYNKNHSPGLVLYERKKNKSSSILSFADFKPSFKPENNLMGFFELANGDIWLAVSQIGIYHYQNNKNQFTLRNELPKKFEFINLQEDPLGNILIQTLDKKGQALGLFLLKKNGEISDYQHLLKLSPQNQDFYSDNYTRWMLAATGDGLKWMEFEPLVVRSFLSNINPGVPFGASMRGICNDGKGQIIVSTERHGWYRLHPKTGETRQLRNSGQLSLGRNLVKAADGSIWGVDNELMQYFPETETFKTWKLPYKVEALALGQSGTLLLGFNGHFGILEPDTGLFKEWKDASKQNPLAGKTANFIIPAQNGHIWIGTDKGLVKINPAQRRFEVYGIKNGFSSNSITCMYEEADGRLWLGTLGGGLLLFNPATKQIEATLGIANGLANANIAGILPDSKGHFWVSTYDGLSYLNPKEKTFRNFYTSDGFSHSEFNRFSFYKDEDSGLLFFGGIKGINSFAPQELLKENSQRPLLLSQVVYYDSDGKSRITHNHFNYVKKPGTTAGLIIQTPIILHPGNRFLHLNFFLSDLRRPQKKQYAYLLEGLDNNWNYFGAYGELYLNYLPVGKYILHIKGADSHGSWSPQTLSIPIVVRQYWYLRYWAWLIWLTMFGIGAWLLYRYRATKIKYQRRLEIEQTEANRLKELNAFKNRIFTNITHEFRTPLAVMLGITRHLEQTVPDTEGQASLQPQLKLIARNGQNLLDLVNQMLDLAKAENDHLKLNFVRGNVLPFLHFVVESFSSLANQQNILLKVESFEPDIVMDYAPESLRQILSNLLSNSLKFTPSGGKVSVEIKKSPVHAELNQEQPSWLFITVSDTGRGVAAHDLPHIFDRFYQSDESSNTGGTGIGLALTKELVKLLNGVIEAQSTPGKGTTFSISLPITHEVAIAPPAIVPQKPMTPSQPEPVPEHSSLPSLLIVEDNADVVEYLSLSLGPLYRLEFAYNGRVGVGKAFEGVPDIIISDVMMPEMGGFELCNTLKNDPRTSHIPIVLLTAKAGVENRIQGLREGADAYLAKPFDQQELLAILDNLIQLRKKLQSRYAAISVGENPAATEAANEPEDTFLQKLRTLVEAEMSNPDLSPQDICRHIGMGHTNLNLKLNALTGMPISLFIRKMRLRKAKELLAHSKNLNITEIAYETGFNDPKYFSRVFAEEFGVPPSAFRK